MILMKSRLPQLATILAGGVLLSSCAALSASDSDTGEVRAAAAFYPLEYAAARVGGDLVTVENLTRPGQEPHDLSMSVRQTGVVADADLVVLEEGFQPAVDEAAATNATGRVLDVTAAADLVPAGEHDHEGEHAGEEEHDHGSTDPHFWLDPLRLADVADAVAAELGEVDPDDAATYDDNAAALRADLEELDREYADGLAQCERDTVVVSHDAFGYLAKYGVHLEPIVGLSPESEPTPADLQRLQELIREEGVTTVFSEPLTSSAPSASLAGDLDIETGVLDPLEGLAADGEDDDYLTIMRRNLAALQEANGC
jgi:zinc transport system substrate-binding protein